MRLFRAKRGRPGRREEKVEAKGKREGSTGRMDADSEADFAIGHSTWSPELEVGRWQLSRDALAGWKPIEGTGEKKGRVRVLGAL